MTSSPAVSASPRQFVQARAGAALPFLLAVTIWGSTWYVIKDQISLASPSWTVVARFVIAAAGMIVLALVRGESLRLPRETLPIAVFIALTQFCLNFQFVCRAQESLTSGIMATLMAVMMIPAAIFARIAFKTPIDRRFAIGSAVALVGIGLLLLKEYRAAPPGAPIVAGLGYGSAAVLSAAAGSVAQLGRRARETAAVPLIAWSMTIGALVNLVFALINEGLPPLHLPARFWGGALYLGIIGSVVPFPIFVGLIRRVGAGRAAYVNVAIPLVAMAVSTVLEQYHWTALAMGGAALSLGGMAIAMSTASR